MKKVFLIGMPFVGKSYWGQQLAGHLNMPFVDLDNYIASVAQLPVPQIFAKRGEAGFRALEHDCLQEVITASAPAIIVACGGGTPCFYNNLEMMKQAGIVLYLRATPEYLYKNYLRNTERRPLLAGNRPVTDQLRDMLALREPVYRQAHYILQAADISLSSFDKILHHV